MSTYDTNPKENQTDAKEWYKTMLRGDSVCEPALWTKWVTVGALHAETDVTMLELGSNSFHEALAEDPKALYEAKQYAKIFVWKLNRLTFDFSDVSELVISAEDLSNDVDDGCDEHYIFLSHCKAEAGTEATMLEEALSSLIVDDEFHAANHLRNPVFLDSTGLTDLSLLKNEVMQSHNLVILLTPTIFERPWCLLEIVTAVKHGIPMVPVVIQRPGLNFQFPDDPFYESLAQGLKLTETGLSILRDEGIQLESVVDCVRKVFVKIALPFSPHKTSAIRQAEIAEILGRCNVMEGTSLDRS